MSKYLVVFDEYGGPETYLENSFDLALERVNTLVYETSEDSKIIAESVVIFEVIKSYLYVPPQGEGSLIEKERY